MENIRLTLDGSSFALGEEREIVAWEGAEATEYTFTNETQADGHSLIFTADRIPL